MILIGAGGHADDIAQFSTATRIAHHKDYEDGPVIIGINDPGLRALVSAGLGVEDLAWVHPETWLAGVTYGYGTHINYGVQAVRTRMGNHCTISPGVTICGDVTIGDRVLVGAGAIVCDRVLIGDDVTVGAGAVVLPESVLPSRTTWVGNPARCIR
jgi:carbonic anhydrase/acetyltransferase-like protein (isoleucine patch superfamily)